MILGIGELLWDLFPDGSKVAGGAPFNFVFHCQQLGHTAAIVSCVGDDPLGQELREHLGALQLDDSYIQTDPVHPTGTVQVRLNSSGVPGYHITENVAWDHIRWDESLHQLTLRSSAVCFGTLAQRCPGSRATIRKLLSVNPQAQRIFDVNLRPPDFREEDLRAGCEAADWLKIAEEELPVLATARGMVPGDPVQALSELLEPPQKVLMTRGSKGYCIVERAGESIRRYEGAGVNVRVADTVGAGDAFTAAIVCLTIEGKSLEDAAQFANLYAACVCANKGSTPRLDRREVEQRLKS